MIKKSKKGCVGIAFGTVLALILVAVLGLWKLGPNYGIYLFPPSPQQYAEQALKQMDQGYYATGPEWEEARERAIEATRDADSYEATLPALREALAVAGGKHSQLFESGQSLDSSTDDDTPPSVATTDGITTVTVPAVNQSGDEYLQGLADQLSSDIHGAAPETSCGWIVDLRGNGGGNMYPMLAGLSPLLADGQFGGFVTNSGDTTPLEIADGGVAVGDNAGVQAADADKVEGPVAVLADDMTGSSGEVTLLAFHGADGVRTFGTPTAGYTSANQTINLYDGTQMLLTAAMLQDRNGDTLAEVPIEPDEETTSDAAPEAAKTWLTEQCG